MHSYAENTARTSSGIVCQAQNLGYLLETEHVKPAERFDYWHNAVNSLYAPIECNTPCRRSFSGSVKWYEFDDIMFSEVQSHALDICRTREHIKKLDEERYLINLQLKGVCQAEQDGRQSSVVPGEILVIDSTKPFRMALDKGFEQIVVSVKKQALTNLIPNLSELMEQIIGRGVLSNLIHDFFSQIPHVLNATDDNTRHHLRGAIIDLIAAGMVSVAKPVKTHSSENVTSAVCRIKSYIRSRINDPALSREDIAEHMGISVRQVNKLLEQDGTSAARLIRMQRLLLVYRQLADSRLAHKSITFIAFDAGFKNMQHFSKVFKQQFGVTPREHRANELR